MNDRPLASPQAHTPQVFSVVSSRRMYEGAVTALRVDEVVMPGGGIAKREVVEHDRAVAVVGVDVDDPELPVILIEQYRHPLRRRLWELPAGLMDVQNEPPQLAASRELFEETGFVARDWSVLVDVATSPGFTDETVRIYLATGLNLLDRPAGVHEEAEIRIVRVPLAAAVQAVLAGRIVNVMAVAGILAADKVLRGDAPTGRPDVPPDNEVDEPWMTHSGPDVPDAPPLDGSPVT